MQLHDADDPVGHSRDVAGDNLFVAKRRTAFAGLGNLVR